MDDPDELTLFAGDTVAFAVFVPPGDALAIWDVGALGSPDPAAVERQRHRVPLRKSARTWVSITRPIANPRAARRARSRSRHAADRPRRPGPSPHPRSRITHGIDKRGSTGERSLRFRSAERHQVALSFGPPRGRSPSHPIRISATTVAPSRTARVRRGCFARRFGGYEYLGGRLQEVSHGFQ